MNWAIYKDSDTVKQLFDYFRNVAIASAVFAAIPWVLARTHTLFFFQLMAYVAAFLLFAVSITLFIINFRHAHFLIYKRVDRDSYLGLGIRLVHGLFIFALFAALTRIDPASTPQDLFGKKDRSCTTQIESK